jgi:hypothetical protein
MQTASHAQDPRRSPCYESTRMNEHRFGGLIRTDTIQFSHEDWAPFPRVFASTSCNSTSNKQNCQSVNSRDEVTAHCQYAVASTSERVKKRTPPEAPRTREVSLRATRPGTVRRCSTDEARSEFMVLLASHKANAVPLRCYINYTKTVFACFNPPMDRIYVTFLLTSTNGFPAQMKLVRLAACSSVALFAPSLESRDQSQICCLVESRIQVQLNDRSILQTE